MTAHTTKEAFDKFDLISGAGNQDTTACAMTMLSWIDGDYWTDSPQCAHPLIRRYMVKANDAPGTTPSMRRALVKAGMKGVLDTWWVPDSVIAGALMHESEATNTVYDRTILLVQRVAAWKRNKLPPNLRDANLRDANLGYANLGSADLRDANLRDADLRSANLRYANLGSADLGSADLRSADLGSADLRDADLRYANLRYANLRSANLGSADLRSANLRYADLRSADLRSANLRDANLGYAKGDAYTRLPVGWTVNPSGLIVKMA